MANGEFSLTEPHPYFPIADSDTTRIGELLGQLGGAVPEEVQLAVNLATLIGHTAAASMQVIRDSKQGSRVAAMAVFNTMPTMTEIVGMVDDLVVDGSEDDGRSYQGLGLPGKLLEAGSMWLIDQGARSVMLTAAHNRPYADRADRTFTKAGFVQRPDLMVMRREPDAPLPLDPAEGVADGRPLYAFDPTLGPLPKSKATIEAMHLGTTLRRDDLAHREGFTDFEMVASGIATVMRLPTGNRAWINLSGDPAIVQPVIARLTIWTSDRNVRSVNAVVPANGPLVEAYVANGYQPRETRIYQKGLPR